MWRLSINTRSNVTYGVFDDVFDEITNVKHFNLIPLMAKFTKNIPDKYFHVALFLLKKLIPSDEIGERPEGFSDQLLAIRLRVEKLSFLPNLICAWDAIALNQRTLKSDNDFLRQYSPSKLAIFPSGWHRFFQYPLLSYQSHLYKDCSADMKWVKKQLRELYQPPGLVKLVYVARIEATKYWVWLEYWMDAYLTHSASHRAYFVCLIQSQRESTSDPNLVPKYADYLNTLDLLVNLVIP